MAEQQNVSRRKFLTYAGLGVAGLAATGAAVKIVSDQVATSDEASGDGSSGVPTAIRNTRCLWGAYVDPGDGTSIGAVENFERTIGRRLDLTRHYIRWDRKLVNGPIEQSAKAGRIPLIAWHTQRLDGSWVRWRDIAKGKHDREIAAQAKLLREWGGEAYFVFNHEPENDPAGKAHDFAEAFDHVRATFENDGVRRLHYVATLMRGTYQGARGGPGDWLPKTCDLLGADGYNRGACNPAIGWEAFDSIFHGAHQTAQAHRKGLVIEEWGCVERGACGGTTAGESKAEWIAAAGATIQSWPEVRGVIYSQVNAAYQSEQVDFRVDTSPESLTSYREVGLRPTFTTRDPQLS
ncbi:MAG: twin-arginine translocation signal domain-containing protein [Actinomycetota bacterium]